MLHSRSPQTSHGGRTYPEKAEVKALISRECQVTSNFQHKSLPLESFLAWNPLPMVGQGLSCPPWPPAPGQMPNLATPATDLKEQQSQTLCNYSGLSLATLISLF